MSGHIQLHPTGHLTLHTSGHLQRRPYSWPAYIRNAYALRSIEQREESPGLRFRDEFCDLPVSWGLIGTILVFGGPDETVYGWRGLRSDCVPNGLVGYTAWANSLLSYSSYVPWGTGSTHEMPYLYLYTREGEGSGSVWQLDAYSQSARFSVPVSVGALYEFGSVTRESPAGAFPGMDFGATPTPDVQVILDA